MFRLITFIFFHMGFAGALADRKILGERFEIL
jgi:hypothetical protein